MDVYRVKEVRPHSGARVVREKLYVLVKKFIEHS